MITLNNTPNKNKLNTNTILNISITITHTTTNLLNQPLYKYLNKFNNKQLPIPIINIINNNSHSNTPITFQKFIILPINTTTFKKSLH